MNRINLEFINRKYKYRSCPRQNRYIVIPVTSPSLTITYSMRLTVDVFLYQKLHSLTAAAI
jgi:hypothetical protein